MSIGPQKQEDPGPDFSGTLAPGSRLGHYEIRALLGTGGMGAVFEATDLQLQRPVALKVMNQASPLAAHGSLSREAQAASALNHPNIITVYEIGQEQGIDFIAMERVEGRSLAQTISGRPLPIREALAIAVQIAAALAAAHESGIVHRDLKPGNVMITPRGLAKVLDFGLAQRHAPADATEPSVTITITEPGKAYGTIAYMSPEQARGQPMDARSDIFAFGCVLYEMVTGRRAFHEEDGLLTLAAIVGKEPRSVREFIPGLPSPVERIIDNCLRKNRLDRWQNMADVKLVLEAALQDLSSTTSQKAVVRRRWPMAVAVLGGVLAGIALYQYWPRKTPPTVQSVLRRVTADTGLTAFPALSLDGGLLAFASDRGGEDNLNLWVQQIGGRDPIRLTSDPADDSDPDFSPDSTRIAFRSERSGGGIYVVPALGGEELLLAPGGRNPHFSPDGRLVAYWEGRELGGYLAGSARVFVVEAGGGQPRQVGTDLAVVLYPVWSPRSDALLVLGRLGDAPLSASLDWWVVPVSGGPAIRTNAFARFRSESLISAAWNFRILPLQWYGESPGRVLFSAGTDNQGNRGDTANLWELELSKAGQAGSVQRVTSGPGYHLNASQTSGGTLSRLAFADVDWQLGVWSSEVDERGTAAGQIHSVTDSEWYAGSPSLSADGHMLSFLNQRLGRWNLRARDFTAKRETALVAGSSDLARSKISGDGRTVVYTTLNGTLYSVPTAGGKVDKLCDQCGAVMGVSFDGQLVVYEGSHSNDLLLLDVARRTSVAVAALPQADAALSGGQFSPDGKWIAFHSISSRQGTAKVWLVPAQPGRAVPSSEWIEVSDALTIDRDPAWSPRGNLIYFASDRDGFRCIWARPLDPVTKRPTGPAVAVLHFHSARRSLRRISARLENNSLSAGGGQLVFAFGELRGNIWLEEKPR